ncbi:ATP-dependent zinc metalloprotease FtsH [Neofamilia massiliensis]|uniref:ATP-dependent zinc metalloprotease FtsH n=1 Tax=Neofamilia massiliensis TaxID=1673724 RepID=UPI0006BB969B|nr:ATP-dependent zinc metalloprotease FtsH [Neofamilia massiliensis]
MGKRRFGIGFYLLILILIYYGFTSLNNSALDKVSTVDHTEFIQLIEKNQVKEIDQQGSVVYFLTADGEAHKTIVEPDIMASFYDKYFDKFESGDIKISFKEIKDNTWQRDIFTTVLMIGGFALIWFFFMQSMQGGGNKTMNFGKSTAKVYTEKKDENVTFKDVAGLHEEKEELEEIVDFLKNPKKYNDVGARIPTGVLMVGPPGTGKTYLSRAVAGEARVPFFTISGSDFVEMFVGVGASRVRDLFENAKKHAPAIIFIDEIDAVGRRRGAGLGGGHDEREQTLNQLLVEMDGFSKNEGIIIMAATNRADILDPALLRPGRFDRTVYVGVPDVRGREAILKVHTRNKPLADDVDLKKIAKRTPGFTPADLENMINEAALLTARENRNLITDKDIHEASIKVQAGPAKKSKIVSDKDKKITAVHEAGHALVSRLLPNYDPVDLITIIPRGRAGGFTAYIPKDDDEFITKTYLENELVTLLGGRVAESLVLNEISTGASNDIERATNIAKSMVQTFGMSDSLGTIKYGTDDDNVFVGRDMGKPRDHSEEVQAKIDSEVHRLIDEAYKKCENIISKNLNLLNNIADVLIERETITGAEFENIFAGKNFDGSEKTSEVEETLEANENQDQENI